jgi:hypothetical protein
LARIIMLSKIMLVITNRKKQTKFLKWNQLMEEMLTCNSRTLKPLAFLSTSTKFCFLEQSLQAKF